MEFIGYELCNGFAKGQRISTFPLSLLMSPLARNMDFRLTWIVYAWNPSRSSLNGNSQRWCFAAAHVFPKVWIRFIAPFHSNHPLVDFKWIPLNKSSRDHDSHRKSKHIFRPCELQSHDFLWQNIALMQGVKPSNLLQPVFCAGFFISPWKFMHMKLWNTRKNNWQ